MDAKCVWLCQVAVVMLTVSLALAYHRPPPQVVTDEFHFHYDPDTGLFVGSNKLTCILVLLDTLEREEVHTTRGIERIELKMMKEWMGVFPEIMVYRTDPLLSPSVQRWCYDRKILMLKRNPSSSTVSVPTGSSARTPAIGTSTPTETFSGTPSVTSGTKSVYQQTTTTPTATTSAFSTDPNEILSEGSTLNVFSTTRSASPVVTMATDVTSETSTGTTTIDLPASATSRHAVPMTTPSVIGPYIVYDNTSQLTAVVVDKQVCYLYHLSDMEKQLVNMGPDIKDAFERALLSKDRANVTVTSENVVTAGEIRRTCKGTIFLFNQ